MAVIYYVALPFVRTEEGVAQRGDQPGYDGLLELFPQNYHEPYYKSYTSEDFRALATSCGLMHIRDVKAFVSKVMVFDKPAVA
jgi:hypothetical protein